MITRRIVVAWLVGSSIACSSGNETDGGMNGGLDATNGDEDGGTPLPAIEFEIEPIDGVGAGAPTTGDNATLSLDGMGRPAIAYGSVPLANPKYEIWYATRGGDGTWTKERAVLPGMAEPMASGQIIGLGLAHVGGVPHLAYLGGDGDARPTTPFPTDLILATRSGNTWTERTLADASGDAPGVCPGTQNTCNSGGVVGSSPGIAARPGGGFAVVYRDTHFGFGRNDYALSDVEVYGEGGPVMRACVDPVRGGGGFGNITFTSAGNPVIAYNLETDTSPPSRLGVWAAAYDGAMWNLVRVADSLAGSKIALATAADGVLWMAFNHATDVDLVVARSSDGGLSWTTEVVDSSGKTGLHPGIAFDVVGRVVVAFGYCGRQSDTDCPGQLGPRSEVRMARLENGAWKVYKVDDGQGFGFVGLFNSVVVTGDGKLGIAFVDEMNGDLLYAREK